MHRSEDRFLRAIHPFQYGLLWGRLINNNLDGNLWGNCTVASIAATSKERWQEQACNVPYSISNAPGEKLKPSEVIAALQQLESQKSIHIFDLPWVDVNWASLCRCLRLKQNVGSQLVNKLIDCEGDIEAACSAADVVGAQGVKIEPLQHMPRGFDERTDANGEGEGGGEGEGNQLEAEGGRRLRSTTPSGRWSVAGGQ